MGVVALIPDSDPILHLEANLWDMRSPKLSDLLSDLVDTMKAHQGMGLAAPQIGRPYKVFVMQAPGKNLLACINPSLIGLGEPDLAGEEGCLSYPGVFTSVKRHRRIEASYWDKEGVLRSHRLNELSARIFQHEFDHLFGITMHDHSTN